MTARRRKRNELYEEYRINLKREAQVERIRLAGKWVWRSFIPHPDDPTKIMKLPPYKRTEPKIERTGRARRALNSADHRLHEEQQ